MPKGLWNRESGGWPGLRFVDMRIVQRISLRYVSRKYRDAEGAAGSVFLNLGLGVDVSFLEGLRCQRDYSESTA